MNLQKLFNTINKNNLDLLDEYYDQDVYFKDPNVEFTDLEQLKRYFTKLYKNIDSIEFQFVDEFSHSGVYVLLWKMILISKKINSGEQVIIDGVSHIKLSDDNRKIIFHQDFYDMGQLVYEHVPVMGKLLKLIKRRLR